MSVTQFIGKKTFFGISGYSIPTYNSSIDNSLSTKYKKSRTCKELSRYYLDGHLKSNSYVPGPNKYKINVEPLKKLTIYKHDRITQISEHMKAASKEVVSPFTYAPEKYRADRIKCHTKMT
jgi:hypothetical protein